MNKDRAIVMVNYKANCYDLDLPLSITVNELLIALNDIFNLGIHVAMISVYYLTSQNPINLLKGNQTLADYNIRNGSIISIPDFSQVTIPDSSH